MRQSELWIACAVLYVERFGLSVIPMDGDKRPLVAWKEFQQRKPTIEEMLSWRKENLAIVTGAVSNLVVVDCESREDAAWFHRQRAGSPVMVQTRRGFHFYFRHPGERVSNGQKIEGRYDVRGDGGYVVAPPSLHGEGAYRWAVDPQTQKPKKLIPTTELPVFKMEWRPATASEQSYDKIIRDGRAYIDKICAVSGSGGHSDTYRAACVLREAGFSEAEAMVALQAWNRTNAEPPWSDKELLHKVTSAYR